MSREVIEDSIFDVSEADGQFVATGVEADVAGVKVKAQSRDVLYLGVKAVVRALRELEGQEYDPWA